MSSLISEKFRNNFHWVNIRDFRKLQICHIQPEFGRLHLLDIRKNHWWLLTVADLHIKILDHPLGVEIISILCSFWGNLAMPTHLPPTRHSMVISWQWCLQTTTLGKQAIKKHYQWGGVSVTRTTSPSNTWYGCKEVSCNRNGQFTMIYPCLFFWTLIFPSISLCALSGAPPSPALTPEIR